MKTGHAHDCHSDHEGLAGDSYEVNACKCGHSNISAFHERIMAELTRRSFIGGSAAILAQFAGFQSGRAHSLQPDEPGGPVLFTNLRLFDGVNRRLQDGVNILVKGNRIEALPGAGEPVEDARIVDCGGRLAMPGLIDAHWHSTLCAMNQMELVTADLSYVHLVASHEAERTLLRGFTTIRDAGGPSFGLKRAIDEGLVGGPRIYPSGAMISQTAGHGDFRFRYEIPRDGTHPLNQSRAEAAGIAMIADGETEVLRRVREQLLLGASQVKLMAGGGVSSIYDPIDVTQYRLDELRAAVDAAEDWGTYVMVHVYTPRGIQRAIKAGVKSIEHGQLADEETVRIMAGEGIWWSLQPFLLDEDANRHPLPEQQEAQERVSEGTVRAYEMAKEYGVKTGWGTDIITSPQNLPYQGRQLAKLTRFYDPLEVLKMATGQNGELVGMSGPRNPYGGKLGVIEPGALADILVYDGDPSESLDFLIDPDTNLKVVMKDGKFYKEAL